MVLIRSLLWLLTFLPIACVATQTGYIRGETENVGEVPRKPDLKWSLGALPGGTMGDLSKGSQQAIRWARPIALGVTTPRILASELGLSERTIWRRIWKARDELERSPRACELCGRTIPRGAPANRQFCRDKSSCRVAAMRARAVTASRR